ncbi:MAG TPA: hypothetical protein VN253_16410 [Kofleriaceae bacterium]|nr:hypothetical protein [Kofleriaceae bacterium]
MMPKKWFTHEVTWILPSGERKPGRLGISEPEPGPFDPPLQITDADKLWRSWYVLEPLQKPAPGPVWHDELSAMYYAFMMLGHYVYWELCRGTRIVYPDESNSPLEDTARLLWSFGPLIRAHGDPRGVADPEGNLSELEAIIEEQLRPREERAGCAESGTATQASATQARAVLTVLQARGVAVPDAIRDRILATTNVEQLKRWLEQAAVATSIGDVLDDQG